jgi:hypothetical protein
MYSNSLGDDTPVDNGISELGVTDIDVFSWYSKVLDRLHDTSTFKELGL